MHHSFDHADAKEEKPSPRTNRTTKHQVNGVEGRDTAAHCLHHEPKHAGQAARRYRDTNHTMQPRGATRCTDPLEPRTPSPPGDRKADRNVVDRPRRTKRQGQERPDRPRGCPVLGWSQPRRQRSSLGQVAQVGGSPTCRSGLSALFGPRLIRRPTRLATTRFNPGGPTPAPSGGGSAGIVFVFFACRPGRNQTTTVVPPWLWIGVAVKNVAVAQLRWLRRQRSSPLC
jgi:hypothetical protein